MASALELRGVSAGYGETVVLEDINLALAPGESWELEEFTFTSGPNRRYVGNMQSRFVQGVSSLPGGVSGDPRSPWFTNLLLLWLTNDTFPVIPDTFPRIPWLP